MYKSDVFEIEVEGYRCYVRSFDRATMKCVLANLTLKLTDSGTEVDASKMLDIGEIGLKNCWLGGDEEILENDRLYVAACMQVGGLFDLANATLKKL